MTVDVILGYLNKCPGPYFRQLVRELSLPVGTAQYWLSRLAQQGLIYVLNLAKRPRYFSLRREA